jgi:hypothetical protein
MARLKHFTRDVKLDVRMDQYSTNVTRFGGKAGVVFEVPDGYYADYCVKKLGCVLVTPQSEMPTPARPAPAPVAAVEPEPVVEAAPAVEPEAPAEEPAAEPEPEATPVADEPEVAPAADEPAADEAAPEEAVADAPAEEAKPAKKQYSKKSK